MSVFAATAEIIKGEQDILLLPLVTSKKGGGLPSRISESGYLRCAGLMFPDEYVEFAHKVWDGDLRWGEILVKKLRGDSGVKFILFSPALDSKHYTLNHLKLMVLNLYRISRELEGRTISTAWPFRCGYVNFNLKDFINELSRYDWGDKIIIMHDKSALTRAQVYADLGVPIIPCIKMAKDPKVSGWVQTIKPRHFHEYILDEDNIAVKLGSDSGLVAVDFDYDVGGVKDKVLSVLPPPDCAKIGSKGLTALYRMPAEGMESVSFWFDRSTGKIPIIEILAEGRKTVIPPSVHPSTKSPYRWAGKSLLQALTEGSLETLTAGTVESIRAIALGAGCYEKKGGYGLYGYQDIDGF